MANQEHDENDIRICFVGDSFVNGTGDPEHLGWVGRVCTLLHTASLQTTSLHTKSTEITHYNLGIRGDTSEDIKERWQREVKIRLPSHTSNKIIFSFGVNDTVIMDGNRRVNLQNSIDTSRQILSQSSSQYDVLMVGPPPIGDEEQNNRIYELDKHFQEICSELSIPYLSIFDTLTKNSVWLKEVSSNDGAHPRAAGYTQLANQVSTWSEWIKC